MKVCVEGFGERKWKGEMQLNCNLKIAKIIGVKERKFSSLVGHFPNKHKA